MLVWMKNHVAPKERERKHNNSNKNCLGNFAKMILRKDDMPKSVGIFSKQ